VLRYLDFTELECSVTALRLGSLVGLSGCFVVVGWVLRHVHGKIYWGDAGERRVRARRRRIHTAVNACLFPPLFFFSGLYYTDVVSTLMVLVAYDACLAHSQHGAQGFLHGLEIWALGLIGLGMRQTNVFWCAVFGAAMAWDQACRRGPAMGSPPLLSTKLPGQLQAWAEGRLPSSNSNDPVNLASKLVALAVSAVGHPLVFLKHTWPYLATLLSFVAFVVWNGGVVLGDKDNHIAQIHLPQLLYFSAFTAFFSFPLLIPTFLSLFNAPKRVQQTRTLAQRLWPMLVGLGCLVGALTIVKHNTLIHPFTLADNRHYMFYVFRYSILRHWAVRYALVPVYLLCGFLVLRALQPDAEVASAAAMTVIKDEAGKQWVVVTPSAAAALKAGSGSGFAPIFLLTTALSLVTAPLVEPRYFIIPWLLWRLHLPSTPAMARQDVTVLGRQVSVEGLKLWMETAWFVAVNVVTCGVFLVVTFGWGEEGGMRFMW
jgi:alpha-1,2-glucosyltransferase